MNMDFTIGTLGQLILVEAFVFYIWLKVLFDAVKTRDNSVPHKKLLLTSLGLVLNAAAIGGIMIIRLHQIVTDQWPFVWGVMALYVMLAIGNFMFIVSASLGTNARLLKVFMLATALWTAFVIVGSII